MEKKDRKYESMQKRIDGFSVEVESHEEVKKLQNEMARLKREKEEFYLRCCEYEMNSFEKNEKNYIETIKQLEKRINQLCSGGN